MGLSGRTVQRHHVCRITRRVVPWPYLPSEEHLNSPKYSQALFSFIGEDKKRIEAHHPIIEEASRLLFFLGSFGFPDHGLVGLINRLDDI